MRVRLPRVRFTIGRLMVGIAIVGIVLGLAYDRLVRQPAKEALRERIESHEKMAVYWEDHGRNLTALPKPSRDAIRAEIAWHRRRARELGRLDPMRVARRTLDKDYLEALQREVALMGRINSSFPRSLDEIGIPPPPPPPNWLLGLPRR